MPWWSFGTRPCCIRLQGLKIEACTRVYPQVSCWQRQALTLLHVPASELLVLHPPGTAGQALYVVQHWACMKLSAATQAQWRAMQALRPATQAQQ